MAIEAERGYSPTCYWCVILGAADRPMPRIDPFPGDPRLRIGTASTTWWRGSLARELDLPESSVTGAFPTDQHLRAYALLISPGRHLNARHVHAMASAVVGNLNTPGAAFPDPVTLLRGSLNQGGYAPTPPNALPDDQVFMLWSAVAAIGFQMPTPVLSAILSQLNVAIDGWRADRAQGGSLSLSSWIVANDAMPLVTG